MRHRLALCAGLLAWLLAGCAGGNALQALPRPDSWHALRAPTGPDFVQMDVALLECPVGDPYINDQLWSFTDEQAAGLDHKALLENNGFRVGLVVGQPPTRFHALLKSERCCVNPRRRTLLANTPAPLLLGPVVPDCRFTLLQGGVPVEVALEQAQCALVVLPTLTADGRTRLRFTPRLEHGEPIRDLRVAPDRSGWTMEIERRSHTYPELSWEVTLAPNEYLAIGACFEEPQSLGYQCFVDRQGLSPVQRLLVIRTSRSGAGVDAEIADPPTDTVASGKSPPLALQATFTSARASGP